MNIKDVYEAGVANRNPYLQAAESLSRLTLPELSPMGYGLDGYQSNISGPFTTELEQPYSSAGTSAVTGLAATILGLLFPVNIPWFELNVRIEQDAGEEDESAIDDLLSQIEQSILERMDEHQYKVVILQSLYRILIEGQVLLQKLPLGSGLRAIPLRNFICKRFNGTLRYIVMREEIPDLADPHTVKYLYTLVDYFNKEVWQQTEGDVASKIDGASTSDYIVSSTSLADMSDYSYGYASRYFGTINNINSLSHDMIRAANITAKAIMFIRPDCGLTPQKIASLKPGQAIVGEKDDIEWFSAGMKLGEWSWVAGYIDKEKGELDKNFALSLSQRPDLITDRQTAESVRRLSQELDSSVGAIAQVLQSTLQRPLALAYLADELKLQDSDELLSQFKVIVTSGSSALSRLAELQSLFNLLGIFANDPEFQQRIDTIAIFTHAAKTIGIPVSNFIRELPPQQQVQQQMPEQMSPQTEEQQ